MTGETGIQIQASVLNHCATESKNKDLKEEIELLFTVDMIHYIENLVCYHN